MSSDKINLPDFEELKNVTPPEGWTKKKWINYIEELERQTNDIVECNDSSIPDYVLKKKWEDLKKVLDTDKYIQDKIKEFRDMIDRETFNDRLRKVVTEDKRPEKFNKKMIISGDIIEVVSYEKPQWKNRESRKGKGGRNASESSQNELQDLKSAFEGLKAEYEKEDHTEAIKEEIIHRATELKSIINNKEDLLEQKQEDNRRKVLSRASKTVRRYINANVFKYYDKDGNVILPKFLTLTFSENLQDFEEAGYCFTKFKQKIERIMGYKLEYVSVVEFQQENFKTTGRKAIHFHILTFNMPFIPATLDSCLKMLENGKLPSDYDPCNNLLTKWRDSIDEGTGGVYIEAVGKGRSELCKDKVYWNNEKKCLVSSSTGASIDNLGAYMTKYMIKGFDEEMLKGQRCFRKSQGLFKPIEEDFYDENLDKDFSDNDDLNVLSQFLGNEKASLYALAKTYDETFTGNEYVGQVNYKQYNFKNKDKGLNKYDINVKE